MKKSRFFKRGGLPEAAPIIETAQATEQKTHYAKIFLSDKKLKARQSVYISRETHASVARIVHLLAMAGREISIGGFIDNIVSEHLESNKEAIARMRRQQLEQE